MHARQIQNFSSGSASGSGSGAGIAALAAFQRNTGINRRRTFNIAGDSISAISTYQPRTLPASVIVPAWLPNTVYAVGNVVKNGLDYYRCSTAGTSAGATGPVGYSASNIADNTVNWRYMPPSALKNSRGYQAWLEAFSLGTLRWNQESGLAGTVGGTHRLLVTRPGTGYAVNETLTGSSGGLGIITSVDASGGILAAAVVNPGVNGSGTQTFTINTAAGVNARVFPAQSAAGTFGMPGCRTEDIVKILPDIVASDNDIIFVHIGTNDLSQSIGYTTMIANLKTIYETIAASGKIVVAIPIMPRDSSLTTAAAYQLQYKVNRFIRAFCWQETWANPNKVPGVLLCDPSRYLTDGTSTTGSPIGAAAAAAGAVTVDGLHPSMRGAQYIALTGLDTVQPLIGALPVIAARTASFNDGYDPVDNPGGNVLDGRPWVAGETVALGAHRRNDTAPVKVYYCTQAGVTAGSGGPTGTGSNIVDNTARWTYLGPVGMSLFAQAFGTAPTAATGIVYTGNIPDRMVFTRLNGTASGTIAFTQENPWSDGQTGQRLKMDFSLGGGSNVDQYSLYISLNPTQLGIEAAQQEVGYFYVEAELEISGQQNMIEPVVGWSDNYTAAGSFETSWGRSFSGGSGSNYGMMNATGEMRDMPNGGKLLCRSTPMLLTPLAAPLIHLRFGFNSSGAAGSATATIRVNNIAVRKAFV